MATPPSPLGEAVPPGCPPGLGGLSPQHGAGPGAIGDTRAACWLRDWGLLWEGGLDRRQMFEPKNVHYCIKLLMAAGEAAPAPRGKPQS